MRILACCFLAVAAAFSYDNTTKDKLKDDAQGKFALVVAVAEWCSHCQELHPDWMKLMANYSFDLDVVIARTTCEQYNRTPANGAELCSALKVSYFPQLFAGTCNGGSSGLCSFQTYDKDISYEALRAFVEAEKNMSTSDAAPTDSDETTTPEPADSNETNKTDNKSWALSYEAISNSHAAFHGKSKSKCVFHHSTGDRYCTSGCSSDDDCDTLGGARCKTVGSFGICSYSRSVHRKHVCPITLYPRSIYSAVTGRAPVASSFRRDRISSGNQLGA